MKRGRARPTNEMLERALRNAPSVKVTFEQLAEEVVNACGMIDCSLQEHLEGLQTVEAHVQAAISAAEEDIASVDGGDVEPA